MSSKIKIQLFLYSLYLLFFTMTNLFLKKRQMGTPFNSGKDTRDVVGRGRGQVALTTY